jgi:methylenetetrahydrofolate dehydrogenase (NADP+)/methenyltetrahydrofolate cyclohydrolase
MPASLLKGKNISEQIKENLKQELDFLIRKKKRNPKLIAIQFGENQASLIYAKAQEKNCKMLGIDYELRKFPIDTKQEEIIALIKILNQDSEIDGIIIQEPLPPDFNRSKIISSINPSKDAEGMHPENLGKITLGAPLFLPCTPAAVMELLNRVINDFTGKEVVIVGHSAIVGKPLSLLLLDKLATVTVCHIGTSKVNKLEEHVRKAEVLIVAVGKANLIKGDWIKKSAIVIDVGINRVNGKIVGDVEFEKAEEKASYITPVPGGVGPLTVTMLMRNLIEAYKLH